MDKPKNKSADLPYTVVEAGGSSYFGKKLKDEEQLKDPMTAWREADSSCIILDKETGWATIWRTTARPSMKARAKGLKAFDVWLSPDGKPRDKLREEVRQLRDLVTPRQPQTRLDGAQILKRLQSIIREPRQASAERLIDAFSRDLRAARQLAFSDKKLIHPFTGEPVAEASGKHGMFIAAVCRLTQQKKRPPTHGDLERELGISPSNCSKLCSQYHLSWLPDDPIPGRRGSF